MSDKNNIFEENPGQIPTHSLQNNFKDHQALLIHLKRENQGIALCFTDEKTEPH